MFPFHLPVYHREIEELVRYVLVHLIVMWLVLGYRNSIEERDRELELPSSGIPATVAGNRLHPGNCQFESTAENPCSRCAMSADQQRRAAEGNPNTYSATPHSVIHVRSCIEQQADKRSEYRVKTYITWTPGGKIEFSTSDKYSNRNGSSHYQS